MPHMFTKWLNFMFDVSFQSFMGSDGDRRKYME